MHWIKFPPHKILKIKQIKFLSKEKWKKENMSVLQWFRLRFIWKESCLFYYFLRYYNITWNFFSDLLNCLNVLEWLGKVNLKTKFWTSFQTGGLCRCSSQIELLPFLKPKFKRRRKVLKILCALTAPLCTANYCIRVSMFHFFLLVINFFGKHLMYEREIEGDSSTCLIRLHVDFSLSYSS